MRRTLALLAVLVLGCGDDGRDPPGSPDAATGVDAAPADAAVDAVPGAFALASPMLANDGAFDPENTCTGANTSPLLRWTDPPDGTASFAVVLTDLSNQLVHWVIYDIPANATELPAGIEKTYAPSIPSGAHQTTSYQPQVRGYLGPCPPTEHTYQFVVYALDAATLPGATMQTTRAAAVAAIAKHALGSATLTGTYAQP